MPAAVKKWLRMTLRTERRPSVTAAYTALRQQSSIASEQPAIVERMCARWHAAFGERCQGTH